jgi:hypothetical protein
LYFGYVNFLEKGNLVEIRVKAKDRTKTVKGDREGDRTMQLQSRVLG